MLLVNKWTFFAKGKIMNKTLSKIRRYFQESKKKFLYSHPRIYASLLYRQKFGKSINWKRPEDLNQWINFLAFKTDTRKWSVLADKLAVRDYVSAKCASSNILVPLLGSWNKPEEINFDSLPDTFVLKANHGCGEVLLVKSKKDIKTKELISTLNEWLNHRFGVITAEPHYLRIKPKLFAEVLLDATAQGFESSSLVDYKVWVIEGKPEAILVIYDRNRVDMKLSLFDTAWNNINEYLVEQTHYKIGKQNLPKPKNLKQMLSAATLLSEGFKEVRVDFYEVNRRLYFGEMTFTSACGRMDYFTGRIFKKNGR